METFFYTAIDQHGKKHQGSLESDSEKQVRQKLREKSLIPVAVKTLEGKNEKSQHFESHHKLSNKELSLLTRQLAILLKSGIPLAEVLHLLSQQTSSKKINTVALKLRSRLLEGQSLSQAIDTLGKAFPPLYKATVSAGESSGKLAEVLHNLANYYEEKADIHQKIKLSLLYPVILTVVSIAVVISLLLFVIPEIVLVFEDLGQQLPEITRLLIALSDFLQANGLVIAGVIFAAFLAIKLVLKIEAVKLMYDTLLLQIPLIGDIIRVLNTSRFIRTLAILSSSKVETMNALLIASQVLSNLSMRQAVESASKQVREGSSLSNALAKEKCFPDITTHLISSGESSGNLSEMLDSTATYHEREVQGMTTTLVGIFEPLLILIMGGLVLVIVIAILLPIFEMNQLVA